MKSDEEVFQSLIVGGLIGAGLGALLSKDKETGASLGAIAGAAILATFRASQKASETNVPMYVEENGNLYYTQPDGVKTFIRKIEKPSFRLEQHFKLK
jgi:hypothetical protein